MRGKAILLVEDEPSIQKLVGQLLRAEGCRVAVSRTLSAARAELGKRTKPDLLILDRRLPDGDGLDLCRELKTCGFAPPILFLSSKSGTTDKVLGLKMGGDDYLAKPFEADELLARVEAILRRSSRGGQKETALSFAGITVDPEKHRCLCGGREVKLAPKEFELLSLFLSMPGKVLSKEFLSRRIWGHDFIDTSRAIEMSIRRLRAGLGPKAGAIETVKGYGFKLEKQ